MDNEIMEDVIFKQDDKNVKNKRQEFPDPIRRELMFRANLRCCNPNCRRLLAAVDKKTNELVIIGEGAHIYPAKENGPRYDKNHSEEDFIKSQENGMWLCPTCHELIDKRNCIANYPAEVLLRWKSNSEQEYSDCLENPTLDFKMKFNDDYFRDVDFDFKSLTDLQKLIFFYCVFNETNFKVIVDVNNEDQMPNFIVSYTKLRNWWNESNNSNLRKIVDYKLKHIGAYDPYYGTAAEWRNVLDCFIKELTDDETIKTICNCNSKIVEMTNELIMTKIFKKDESRLERFSKLFE